MRVAMVILEYAPIIGGAQRQLAALAPLLGQRGVDVQVLTRRVDGLSPHEIVDGVDVHRLPAPGGKVVAGAAFVGAALARLAALRPDVVHAYSLFSPSTIAALAGRSLGVPTVAKVLRGGRQGEIERIRAKPLARVRGGLLRGGIDRFVAISREIEDELGAFGLPRNRCTRIPNGVDPERFAPTCPRERSERRQALGWGDAPTVVYCGRLVVEKRVDRLVALWPEVRRRHPEARLVVVGDGPERLSLEAAARDGIRFEGEIGDVAAYLQAADLFVLPSRTEGLSNALLEAMAAGLPVVATRVGAASEVIVERSQGHLVRPDDPGELVDAIISMLGDPARVEIGARARARVVDAFALTSVADRMVALYRTLAAGGPAASAERVERGMRA